MNEQEITLPPYLAGITRFKLEVHVPESHLEKLMTALSQSGAAQLGFYDFTFAVSPVIGYWRARKGSKPYQGEISHVTSANEMKVETYCDLKNLPEALRAIYEAHPYEVPR